VSDITRPVLRYHGGKFRLAPWIISHFPAHRVYVEPFGGAASVLLRKPRSYAEVYNDLDGEIVNVFRVLRNPAQARELERVLRLTPFAREEFELSYISDGDPIEQARRTIVRAFMGFGSNAHNRITGFRSNSNRSGTTPAHDWDHYPNALPEFIERLRGVVIENKDAVLLIPQHDQENALFYVDPPYVHSTRKDNMENNYRHEMTDDQHRELAAVLRSVQGAAIISGYPCPLYDEELYPDWQTVDRKAYADGAAERTERLWLSPNVKQNAPTLFEAERVAFVEGE
jgi:DNA adenine methylase